MYIFVCAVCVCICVYILCVGMCVYIYVYMCVYTCVCIYTYFKEKYLNFLDCQFYIMLLFERKNCNNSIIKSMHPENDLLMLITYKNKDIMA